MAKARRKRSKKIKKKQVRLPDANPDFFINRETSWLEFNRRVLNEARDIRTPLIERLRFISIYASNLDEFVMKRVGGLMRLQDAGISINSVDGKSVGEQLSLIRTMIEEDAAELLKIYKEVMKEFNKEKVFLETWDRLTKSEKTYLNKYFKNNIFPVLTPLLVDPGHPFPFISNLSYSMAIVLENPNDKTVHFSRVKIPEVIPFWIKLPSNEGEFRYIKIDEILFNNLDALFPGMKIISMEPFKVTRNADIDQDDDEADDLLELVEEGLKERKFAECVRLEVFQKCDPKIKKFLVSALDITEDEVFELKGDILDYNRFKEILKIDLPNLKYKSWTPRVPADLLDDSTTIFTKLKAKDILVHHPYESFSRSVENFISQAAVDPNVMAIKMTLYRTGDNSPFIEALKRAAENGKQVVCLVELKARFDESRNIKWAQVLENAGVHVVYGLIGLKTHSKISLVIRKEKNGIFKPYVHIGTGNYHSGTSNLYTDFGLLTTNDKLCSEVIEVFNYLTGLSLKTDYEKLLLAPINMKSTFLKLIHNEARNARAGKPARIIAKMNSMEDVGITQALYEASQAGVKIELYVRGFCCLKPGQKGLSENIQVISIIGRFLEHSRIFYFANGKQELADGDYFIGSADWMHRNLHKRVEVITPIEDPTLKQTLADFFEVLRADNRQAWDMKNDGTYTQRFPTKDHASSGTHDVMMKKYNHLEKGGIKLF